MEPKGLPKWAMGHPKPVPREMSQRIFKNIPCGKKPKEVTKQGATGLWLLVVFYQKSINKSIERIVNKSAVRKTWKNIVNCSQNGAEKVPKTTQMEPKGCQVSQGTSPKILSGTGSKKLGEKELNDVPFWSKINRNQFNKSSNNNCDETWFRYQRRANVNPNSIPKHIKNKCQNM